MSFFKQKTQWECVIMPDHEGSVMRFKRILKMQLKYSHLHAYVKHNIWKWNPNVLNPTRSLSEIKEDA